MEQTGVSKSPKGPPFRILKTLRFLSLRYSADFGRSWLVLFRTQNSIGCRPPESVDFLTRRANCIFIASWHMTWGCGFNDPQLRYLF